MEQTTSLHEYLLAGGAVIVALIGIIYKTLINKIYDLRRDKVDKVVCDVVRQNEEKALNNIGDQLEKMWGEIRETRDAVIREIKKNGRSL